MRVTKLVDPSLIVGKAYRDGAQTGQWLGTPAAPRLETERLILRGWLPTDFETYKQLLADSETARFITRRGVPYSAAETWMEYVFFIGHWQALGHGMFVVEERTSGAFIGRVGSLCPPHWPGLEIAWALSQSATGNGYAVEAARAAIDWTFRTQDVDRLISIIDPRNKASERVAERLGEVCTDERFSPFGDDCRVWALTRHAWSLEADLGADRSSATEVRPRKK